MAAARIAGAVFLTFAATAMSGSSAAKVNESLGGSASSLGQARTGAQILGLCLGFVMSHALRRLGPRAVLLFVIATVALGQVCVGCAAGGLVGAEETPRLFLIGTVLNGVSLHALTAGKEMLARAFHATELASEYGKLSMYSALAYVAGPIAFIALHDGLGIGGDGNVYFIALVPLVAAVCIAATLPIAQKEATAAKLAPATPRRRAPAAASFAAGGEGATRGGAEIALAMLTAVLVAFPFSTMMQALDLYLSSRFQLEPGSIAATTVVIAVSYAVSQAVLFPRAHARWGSARALIGAGAIVATVGATVDSISSFPLWISAMALCVAAMAVAVSASDVLMVELAAPNTATGNARASTIASINNCISPSTAGAILDRKLPLFRVSAAAAAMGVVLGMLTIMPAAAAAARAAGVGGKKRRGVMGSASATPRRSARLSTQKQRSLESARKTAE